MPESFSVTVDFSKLPMADIARARSRGAGASQNARLKSLSLVVLFGLAGFALGTLAVIRFGPLGYDAEFLRALVPLAGFLLGVLVAQSRLRAAAFADLASAPYYAAPRTVHFGPEGIDGIDARTIRWDWIDPVVTYDGGTALFYSPVQYVPVPDASLPAGISRAAFLDRIEAWRT